MHSEQLLTAEADIGNLVERLEAHCDFESDACHTQVLQVLREDPRLLAELVPVSTWAIPPASRASPPGHAPSSETSYARDVLYSDPAGRYTIIAITWQPGQHSPVHAHQAWCAYAVAHGRLHEESYRWTSSATAPLLVRKRDKPVLEGGGSAAGMGWAHRLGNHGDQPAISIHVYGVAAARIHDAVNYVSRHPAPAFLPQAARTA